MSKLDASSRSVKERKANVVQAGVRSISRPAPRHGDEKCVGVERPGCRCPPGPGQRPKVVGRADPTRPSRPGSFADVQQISPWDVWAGPTLERSEGSLPRMLKGSLLGMFTGVTAWDDGGCLSHPDGGSHTRDAWPVPRRGHSRGSLLVMFGGVCPVCPGDPGDPALCCSGGPSFSRPPGPLPRPLPRDSPRHAAHLPSFMRQARRIHREISKGMRTCV